MSLAFASPQHTPTSSCGGPWTLTSSSLADSVLVVSLLAPDPPPTATRGSHTVLSGQPSVACDKSLVFEVSISGSLCLAPAVQLLAACAQVIAHSSELLADVGLHSLIAIFQGLITAPQAQPSLDRIAVEGLSVLVGSSVLSFVGHLSPSLFLVGSAVLFLLQLSESDHAPTSCH